MKPAHPAISRLLPGHPHPDANTFVFQRDDGEEALGLRAVRANTAAA